MRGGRQLRSQFTKIASADITVACNYDGCTLMNSGSGSNCTMTTTLSEDEWCALKVEVEDPSSAAKDLTWVGSHGAGASSSKRRDTRGVHPNA
jgi:hypothetical protein